VKLRTLAKDIGLKAAVSQGALALLELDRERLPDLSKIDVVLTHLLITTFAQ
jgi:hypothetical protein